MIKHFYILLILLCQYSIYCLNFYRSNNNANLRGINFLGKYDSIHFYRIRFITNFHLIGKDNLGEKGNKPFLYMLGLQRDNQGLYIKYNGSKEGINISAFTYTPIAWPREEWYEASIVYMRNFRLSPISIDMGINISYIESIVRGNYMYSVYSTTPSAPPFFPSITNKLYDVYQKTVIQQMGMGLISGLNVCLIPSICLNNTFAFTIPFKSKNIYMWYAAGLNITFFNKTQKIKNRL